MKRIRGEFFSADKLERLSLNFPSVLSIYATKKWISQLTLSSLREGLLQGMMPLRVVWDNGGASWPAPPQSRNLSWSVSRPISLGPVPLPL